MKKNEHCRSDLSSGPPRTCRQCGLRLARDEFSPRKSICDRCLLALSGPHAPQKRV